MGCKGSKPSKPSKGKTSFENNDYLPLPPLPPEYVPPVYTNKTTSWGERSRSDVEIVLWRRGSVNDLWPGIYPNHVIGVHNAIIHALIQQHTSVPTKEDFIDAFVEACAGREELVISGLRDGELREALISCRRPFST